MSQLDRVDKALFFIGGALITAMATMIVYMVTGVLDISPRVTKGEWYYRGPAMCQDVAVGGFGPRPTCVEIRVRAR